MNIRAECPPEEWAADGDTPGGLAWLAARTAGVRLGRDRFARPAAWLVGRSGEVIACLGFLREGEREGDPAGLPRWASLCPRGVWPAERADGSGLRPLCPFPASLAALAALEALSLAARALLEDDPRTEGVLPAVIGPFAGDGGAGGQAD